MQLGVNWCAGVIRLFAVPAVNGQPVASGEAPRLIALNMALNGASREEISNYLAENFDLDDPGGLLDEVWARVNG